MSSNLELWEISLPIYLQENCDALFSEIFRSTTFLMPGDFDVTTVENDAMKENFFSEYKSAGFRSHCQKTVTDNSGVLLNYLSIHDFSVFCNSSSEIWSNPILSSNLP